MKSFQNPLAPKTNRLQAKTVEIKDWVRQAFYLSDDTPITVAELACRDEGCPDIETVIGILHQDKPIQTLRIHLPLAEVTNADVLEAAATFIAK
ncbi:MAG: nitrate reductase [Pseudomonadota bacterium]